MKITADTNLLVRAVAHSGRWLGGHVLATFDRKAAALLDAQGTPTLLLNGPAAPARLSP